jgi:8-oxo-dGTP diphosphatase
MSASAQAYNMRVGVNAAIIKDGSILLIAFDDDSGFHYNLPGGGIQAGESVHEALKREALEEACAEIEIGPLLLVTEYEPVRHADRYGPLHKLGLIFACQLKDGCRPRLPAEPDANQVGVHWIGLDQLPDMPLLPRVSRQLADAYYAEVAVDRYILLMD